MVFNTGAALLDAVVLAVVSKEKERCRVTGTSSMMAPPSRTDV